WSPPASAADPARPCPIPAACQGSDHICMALGRGEDGIGIQRIADIHGLAPLAIMGIHPIPGIDATIFAPNHGLYLVYQFLISEVRLLVVLLGNTGRHCRSLVTPCPRWRQPGTQAAHHHRATAGWCH